jgi:hypothetical protein
VEEYASMNPFINYRYNQVNLTAVSSMDGRRIEIQYRIPMDKLPQTLGKEIQ